MKYFETRFLVHAEQFIADLDPASIRKVLYNIRFAEHTNDPRLFKKLRDEIWEFRVRVGNKQIRLIAFWDKRDALNTLVIATHGFIKKTGKLPGNEIDRAKDLRRKYFQL